jgi:hypothetical protein
VIIDASRARWLVTAAIAAAILSPLLLPRGWDGFPISSYPMFSRGDLGRVVSLGHAVRVAGDGSERPIPPRLVGTPEPMVAKNLIEGAIARGEAAALCTAIARRVAADSDEGGARPTSVAIVTSAFDTRVYFAEGRERAVRSRQVHATCEVLR